MAEHVQNLSRTPHLAAQVAEMSIVRPDVLRVTPAYKALRKCGEAFRHNRDLHHESKQSEEISSFWSHSWHGNSWQKMLTLMVLYNGLPSILCGTCAALIPMALFSLGFLPGLVRVEGEQVLFSMWSLVTGFFVAIATFVLWRPRQAVFFDRICISEDNPRLKLSAILSLAGMLKKSREMLVLWDPSWSDRLWCLFELAAFLKCKTAQQSQQVLIMRPTFIGSVSLAGFFSSFAVMLAIMIFMTFSIESPEGFVPSVSFISVLAVDFIGCFFATMALRGYFYSVEVLQKKLGSASFDQAKCLCCESHHQSPTGQHLPCDREVLKQCVTIWFGSTAAFEEAVRSELSDIVATELRHDVFTRGWAVRVSSPTLWGFMDLIAAHLRIAQYDVAFEFFATGLVVWLGCAPMLVELCIFLTRRYCRQCQVASCGNNVLLDFFFKLWLTFLFIGAVALLGGIYFLIRFLLPSTWTSTWTAFGRAGAFAGFVLILAVLVELLKRVTLTKRSQGRPATPAYDGTDETPPRPRSEQVISL